MHTLGGMYNTFINFNFLVPFSSASLGSGERDNLENKMKTLIYKQEDGVEHQAKIKYIVGGDKTPSNKILLTCIDYKNKNITLWCQHFYIKGITRENSKS